MLKKICSTTYKIMIGDEWIATANYPGDNKGNHWHLVYGDPPDQLDMGCFKTKEAAHNAAMRQYSGTYKGTVNKFST